MKKLLATSALAIVAMSGAASAQSVLERVLGQIDNATNLASVNGTFANIAENIGNGSAVTVYQALDGTGALTGDVLSEDEYQAGLQDAIDGAIASSPVPSEPNPADYGDLTIVENQTAYNNAVLAYDTALSNREAAVDAAVGNYEDSFQADMIEVSRIYAEQR